MAKNSAIEWTDNTANFWWGCLKVSSGCQHCYADTLAHRYGKDIWGPAATTSREYKKAVWANVVKWDKEARAAGIRQRMFVMSMGDFLEDHPQVIEWRNQAIDLLYALTNTDVQLLTKRPENARRFLPESWFEGSWPKHIWMGVSVENQAAADERIPALLTIPAAVRFLSMEPLLGPVDLTELHYDGVVAIDALNGMVGYPLPHKTFEQAETKAWPVNWVIVGGESGQNARPMHPDWALGIRDQCQSAGVPFFFKQWGEWLPGGQGGDMKFQAMPGEAMRPWIANGDSTQFYKIGKHAAGRLLDGREWNEFPQVG